MTTTARTLAESAGRVATGTVRQVARGLVAVPVPERPYPTITGSDSWHIAWMSADATRVYGYQQVAGTVGVSTDDGATWTALHTFPAGMEGVRETGDGELLAIVGLQADTAPGEIWKSSGYPTLGAAATWTKVLTSSASTNYIERLWGLSVTGGSVVVASEYGDKTPPTNPRYVYLSQDCGTTWTTVFDLGTAANAHVHGCAWDPYWSRIWVVSGDVENRSIRFSDDFGVTWHIVSSGLGTDQPTAILPMRDCILFGSDSAPNAILRIWRREKADPLPPVEVAYIVEAGTNLTVIAAMAFWRGPGYPALFPFIRSATGAGLLIATFDGVDFFQIWRDLTTYATPRGLETMVGPTASGRLVGTIFDDRTTGKYSRLTMSAPAVRWMPPKSAIPTVQTYVKCSGVGPAYSNDASVIAASTVDLDVRVKCAHETWTFGAAAALMAKQSGADGTRSWQFLIRADGRLQLQWYPLKTNTGNLTALSSVAPTVAAGRPSTFRATLDVDNGASGWTCTFYTSSDEGVTWTALGTATTTAGVTSLPADELAQPVTVGGSGAAAQASVFSGKFWWATVAGVIGGPPLADVDFTSLQWSPGDLRSPSTGARQPHYVDTQGHTWQMPPGTVQIVGNQRANPQSGADLPVITGSRSSATATVLAALLTALADQNLIVDSTTA